MPWPKLLADCNVPHPLVQFLRSKGIDVASAIERRLWSHTDPDLLDLAATESRWVLTHDAGLGGHALRAGLPTGVICVRPGHLPPPEAIEIVDKWLEADMDWGSPAAVVLTRARIRVRRELPL